MSTYQHKPNTGSLFKNDKKTDPKHPDSRGTAFIDGKLYRISGWTKDGKGKKFSSLVFTLDNAQSQTSTPEPPKASDDDLPF
jgi:hypothetical protein